MWTLLLGAAFAIQLAYWGLLAYGFRQAGCRKEPGATKDADAALSSLSVVVAARNEAENLSTLLAALARQTHPAFEVVVVDDASTDETAAIVRQWSQEHENVRLVQVKDPTPPRKKHALTRGIATARHDLLALTDADCEPPPGWLSALARCHAASEGPSLLIGYSPERPRIDLLGRLSRYETFVTGFLTAAAVGLGRPYMAVGRNLSYPRALFRRLGGFEHSRRSMSGDDDLFVQHVARHRAATARHPFDPETFVETDAPETWRAWLHQKRRHTSAGRFYKKSVQAHLTLFQLSGLLLWLSPLFAGWTGAGFLAGRLLVQRATLRKAAERLEARDLMPWQPLLDALYTGYHLLVVPLGLLKMPKTWARKGS